MPIKQIIIDKETIEDLDDIRAVVSAAFENHPHSNQTEHILVDALRDAGALTVSLVAKISGRIVGHIAFSPVTIDGKTCNWYGLAPVSVHPDFQRQGIGGLLVKAGLSELHTLGALGCVLLGEPEYYGRFGFKTIDGVTLVGVPPEYFLALPFIQDEVQGAVTYHEAFAVCG